MSGWRRRERGSEECGWTYWRRVIPYRVGGSCGGWRDWASAGRPPGGGRLAVAGRRLLEIPGPPRPGTEIWNSGAGGGAFYDFVATRGVYFGGFDNRMHALAA
jgi:hypothetical protein